MVKYSTIAYHIFWCIFVNMSLNYATKVVFGILTSFPIEWLLPILEIEKKF
jgi:hypothetical protein